MKYRWDSWFNNNWNNIKRYTWAQVLEYFFGELKDTIKPNDSVFKNILKTIAENTRISESQIKEIIKNISDNTSIKESQYKDILKSLIDTIYIKDSQIKEFLKSVVDNTNISESQTILLDKLISDSSSISDLSLKDLVKSLIDSISIVDSNIKDVSKMLPSVGEDNFEWQKHGSSSWEFLKDKSWLEVLKNLSGAEQIDIIEYFTAIVTKYRNSDDYINTNDNLTTDLIKSSDDKTDIQDIVSFISSNLYSDIANSQDLVLKEITKNLPTYVEIIWDEYINSSWSELKNKKWFEVLMKEADTEIVSISEYFHTLLTKYIKPEDLVSLKEQLKLEFDKDLEEVLNLQSMSFIDFFKSLQDSSSISDFITKLIEKNLQDISIVSESYKKDFSKSLTDNTKLSDSKKLDFSKNLNDKSSITDHIIKDFNKNISDTSKATENIKKDISKNLNDKTQNKDSFYYKLTSKPKLVEINILDMNYKKIAILTNAWDVCISETINGEYSLSFKMPFDEEYAEYIDDKHYAEVDGQIFMFTNITDERTQSGEKIKSIEAQHIFFELNNYYWPEDDEAKNYRGGLSSEPHTIITEILQGTSFSIEYMDGFQGTDILLKRGSILENLKIIVDAFNMEVYRNNFKLSFYKKIGIDRGIQFRYAKNIKTIKKNIDIRNVVDRLYVYGKNGLTIDGVNNNKAYLDSQYIGDFNKIRTSEVVFNDIENPELLKEKGEAYLRENEIPKVSYDINVLELRKLSGMIYDESFKLGDNVTVIDDELKTDVKARIVEYKYYPFEAKESNVVLGNFIPRATSFFNKLNNTSSIVDNAFFKSNGKLNTKWLDGIIDTLRNNIVASGAFQNAEVIEDRGILLENTCSDKNKYGALYLGPGVFSIANSKTDEGKWLWRTFGTGGGFTADVINTGTLNANLVQVEGLKVGKNVTMSADSLIQWDGSSNDVSMEGLITQISQKSITTDFLISNKIKTKYAEISDSAKIAGKLTADCVYAGDIKAQQITTGDFHAENLTVTGLHVGRNVTMSADSLIQWDGAGNDISMEGLITQISRNSITTDFLISNNIKAKYAEISDSAKIAGKLTVEGIEAIKLSADQIISGNLITRKMEIHTKEEGSHIVISKKGLFGFKDGLVHGILIDNDNPGYRLYDMDCEIAQFGIDRTGTGIDEARNRVFLKTSNNYPLKLFGDGGISFEASGNMYFGGMTNAIEFNTTCNFIGNVDFSKANIMGLNNVVARFG